ncbi:PAS domain S-box protein [Streptomyces sp. NPDC001970]
MSKSTETAISEPLTDSETVGTAIALLHAEGTVLGWSRAAQQLVGYSAADLVGRSADVLLVASDDRA